MFSKKKQLGFGFFSRMIAVVTMMFPGRDFCDSCPFLVPPSKAKGVTASSMVRWAPNGSKYTLTSSWALGEASWPEWWKKLLISHKAPTAQLSRQHLKMCCAYGGTRRWCFTYVPFWSPVKLLVFMSVSVCLPDARFSLKDLCGSDICPVLSRAAVGVSRGFGDPWQGSFSVETWVCCFKTIIHPKLFLTFFLELFLTSHFHLEPNTKNKNVLFLHTLYDRR